MNECRYCDGTLEETTVSRVQFYNGKWYLIENVPALVCRQCGETYFTPTAHDRVLEQVRHAKPVRIEQLAVLDASLQ